MEEKEFSKKIHNYLKLNIYLLIIISSVLVIYTHDLETLIGSLITTIIKGILFFTFMYLVFHLAFKGLQKLDYQDEKGIHSKINLKKSYFWISFSLILVSVLTSVVLGYIVLFKISLYSLMGLFVGNMLKKHFNKNSKEQETL